MLYDVFIFRYLDHMAIWMVDPASPPKVERENHDFLLFRVCCVDPVFVFIQLIVSYGVILLGYFLSICFFPLTGFLHNIFSLIDSTYLPNEELFIGESFGNDDVQSSSTSDPFQKYLPVISSKRIMIPKQIMNHFEHLRWNFILAFCTSVNNRKSTHELVVSSTCWFYTF